METYRLDQDIKLLCVKAESFPDGIIAAQDKLIAMTSGDSKSSYFGVSYLYDDKILYMAGVQTKERNENLLPGCEAFTLKAGNYISVYVSDFVQQTSLIEKTFKMLLDDPGIDPNGCCVECYLPEGCNPATANDVRCMIRLAD